MKMNEGLKPVCWIEIDRMVRNDVLKLFGEHIDSAYDYCPECAYETIERMKEKAPGLADHITLHSDTSVEYSTPCTCIDCGVMLACTLISGESVCTEKEWLAADKKWGEHDE
jgi:hypothetical protein